MRRTNDPPAPLLPQDLYSRLRSLIVAGRIAPGSRLVETDLARRMQVSRTPVREAMRRLAHDGLAQSIRVGAKTHMLVTSATVADLIDLFAIIGALEGIAARGVVQLATRDRTSLARELGALNDRFVRLARSRSRDPDAFFESHDAFHAALVARCASIRLRGLVETVRPQVKRYEVLYAAAVGPDFSASVAEHRAIVSAVRKGTADEVERAVKVNWTNSARRLSIGFPAAAIGSLGTFD